MDNKIDNLLARRQTRRVGLPGNHLQARSRIDLTKFLAENFVAFDPLRNHLFHPEHGHTLGKTEAQSANTILDRLHDLGWIVPGKNHSWRPTNFGDSHAYLSGGWLEELAFCAHEAAGVDEANYGQDVEWQVEGVTGRNEIDVIARRGEVLSFTSCKTLQPEKTQSKSNTLRGFLSETDYWNIHFANDQGRALLIVTADFYNEMRHNKHRYPELLARASILEVSLVGLEDLRWDRLVERVHEHWQ
jgi:hypothetical protein